MLEIARNGECTGKEITQQFMNVKLQYITTPVNTLLLCLAILPCCLMIPMLGIVGNLRPVETRGKM